jgi:hypothetical protein
VLIDSGPNPPGSLNIQKAVNQLAAQPFRFLINTATHVGHTIGNFVFSPPALVIGSLGSIQGIKNSYDPTRAEMRIEREEIDIAVAESKQKQRA